MGLNTIHDTSKDVIKCHNVTKNLYFRCEKLGSMDCTRFEAAQGLGFNQLKMAIRINGNTTIERNDIIEILGLKMKVATISDTNNNELLFKRRNDIKDFTGDTVVGLE